MKIGMANLSIRDDIIYNISNLSSGYENIAFSLGIPWSSLEKVYSRYYDILLVNGLTENLLFLKKHGRPNCKKLILMEEAGYTVINNVNYMLNLLNVKDLIDGIMVHSFKISSFFNFLRVPIITFGIPYPFEFYPDLNQSLKDNNKICIDLMRFLDPNGGLNSTLDIFNNLNEKFYGIAYCNIQDIPIVTELINKCGLKNIIKVNHSIGWKNYIKEISSCKLFLTMDNRYTWGRFALDADLVGGYCIGTYSEIQNLIYSEYITEFWNYENIYEHINILSEKKENFIIDDVVKQYFSYNYNKEYLLEKFGELI